MSGAWKVYCVGPGDNELCSYNANKLFKDKKVNFYRCVGCWKVFAKKEKERLVIFVDKNGETQAYRDHQKLLDLHTHHWDDGPDGQLIRFGWDNKPLEFRYLKWWNLKQATKETLPSGYAWCYFKQCGIAINDPACSQCSKYKQCGKVDLDQLKKRDLELKREIKKMQDETRIERIEKKRLKEFNKTKAVENKQKIINNWVNK